MRDTLGYMHSHNFCAVHLGRFWLDTLDLLNVINPVQATGPTYVEALIRPIGVRPFLIQLIVFDLSLFDLHVIRTSDYGKCNGKLMQKKWGFNGSMGRLCSHFEKPLNSDLIRTFGIILLHPKWEDLGDSDLWGRYTRVRVRRPPRRPRQYIWWTYWIKKYIVPRKLLDHHASKECVSWENLLESFT